MLQDVSKQALKSLSCFAAVTFYSTSQLCAHECFINANAMSTLYFLSTIAKPLFFTLIGFVDSADRLTRKEVVGKIKSVIVILIFWNAILSFITFEYIQRGYILQNGIMLGMAIIYCIYPIIIKGTRHVKGTLAVFAALFALSAALDRFELLSAEDDPFFLSRYSLIWIWGAYYMLGHLLGSRRGQRFTHRVRVVWLARLLVIPLGFSLYFYEHYLSTYTPNSVTLWFFLEHLHLMALALALFIVFDNFTVKNKLVTRIVEFISPAMVGVYIVHYSVFYFISTLYDFNDVSLKFALLVSVFIASVLLCRLLLTNRFTAWTISF